MFKEVVKEVGFGEIGLVGVDGVLKVLVNGF